MPDILVELFSEEIPARMQLKAADDLRRLAEKSLQDAALTAQSVETHVTPRRLVLYASGVPEQQPDTREERKGPKTDAPPKAIEGFLRGAGLENIAQAEQRETPKGVFYYAVREKKGQATRDILPALIADILAAMPWQKSMRWGKAIEGENRAKWVRPLRHVLALYDGVALQAGIGFGKLAATPQAAFNLQSDATPVTHTYGHRFLADNSVMAEGIQSYRNFEDLLFEKQVILSHKDRQNFIETQAKQLAKGQGLTLKEDPGLLEEVAGLVEWPVVLMGSIDAEFMFLPEEVLVTSMRVHQRYFALRTKKGELANRFIVVANNETSDAGKTIISGNERVLRARLSDAKFFWEQDTKTPLSARAVELGSLIFHARLGTMDRKVDRIEALALEVGKEIDGADLDHVRIAARLAKADLTSGMVGEFPELQGIMGSYYARHDGENLEVANAIADHYAPLGPNDRCPLAPVSVAVALADKIDSLVGLFAIGEKPTGSKDPFALRRAALGVIRLILENKLRISLLPLFGFAASLYPKSLQREGLEDELLAFFAERLKTALRDKGVRHDLIEAIFALGGEDDLVRLLDRVEALREFLTGEDGANLLTAYRRAANIVRIESKKDGIVNQDEWAFADAVQTAMLQEREEITLFQVLEQTHDQVVRAIDSEDFKGAMAAMANLRGPVDAFFDNVMVNDPNPDLRENRLRLLSHIGRTLEKTAALSKVEG